MKQTFLFSESFSVSLKPRTSYCGLAAEWRLWKEKKEDRGHREETLYLVNQSKHFNLFPRYFSCSGQTGTITNQLGTWARKNTGRLVWVCEPGSKAMEQPATRPTRASAIFKSTHLTRGGDINCCQIDCSYRNNWVLAASPLLTCSRAKVVVEEGFLGWNEFTSHKHTLGASCQFPSYLKSCGKRFDGP